jgi:predicted MFS family arabinose efflux permease
LFQTTLAGAAGEAADVAQSMLVTAWNVAIAGGGLTGGVLLDMLGVRAFPPVLLALLVPTFAAMWITGGKPKTHRAHQ